ncbi:hypothetical protein M9435_002999 [Picochlorum sp. BPE23]|nr:hypothetical protein M9435_002999 [Picochlorum sp. BPE23]
MSRTSLVAAYCGICTVFWYIMDIFRSELGHDGYMDEIFHIPQAQKYCKGDVWSWDSKITTFPGLYALSAVAHGTVQSIVSADLGLFFGTACSVEYLRSFNVFLGIACVGVVHGIVQHQLGDRNSRSTMDTILMVLVCAILPVHFFFVFLYYTDTASSLFVLSTWLALMKRQYTISGLLAMCAILMRQTNAVWVVYIMGCAVLDMERDAANGSRATWASLTTSVLSNIASYMSLLWLHTLSVLLFITFVVHNKGIVVGDKENHVPVTHWVQPFYFYLYLVVTSGPLWLSRAARSLSWRHFTLIFCLLSLLAYMAVEHGTLAHPFILADNRHYTFYVWRRLINASRASRYLLTPVYGFCASIAIFSGASGVHDMCRKAALLVCTAVVLIPAHLVEFRYFTIPWLLYILDKESVLFRSNRAQLLSTVLAYCAINVATMYIFLHRAFTWPDGSIARFMW